MSINRIYGSNSTTRPVQAASDGQVEAVNRPAKPQQPLRRWLGTLLAMLALVAIVAVCLANYKSRGFLKSLMARSTEFFKPAPWYQGAWRPVEGVSLPTLQLSDSKWEATFGDNQNPNVTLTREFKRLEEFENAVLLTLYPFDPTKSSRFGSDEEKPSGLYLLLKNPTAGESNDLYRLSNATARILSEKSAEAVRVHTIRPGEHDKRITTLRRDAE